MSKLVHHLILYQLRQIQKMPYYATINEELLMAENTIIALEVRVSELEALVGTVRGIAGCPVVRNVSDIGVEQHSREISDAIYKK